MVITNTAKLFMRNGGLVWRIFAYMALCILIVCGLSMAVCYPLITSLNDAGFFTQLADLLEENFANIRLEQSFGALAEILILFGTTIIQNLANMLPYVILLCVIICFGSFLLGLGEMAVADCLYGYMGSNSKHGFLSCYVKNFRKSIKLQLAKLAINVPLNLIIFASFVGILMLFNIPNIWLKALIPTICVFVLAILTTLKTTLFCAWTPCVIVKNQGVWASLRESVKGVEQNFGKIFGRQLVVKLCFIALNMAAIILTACVALALTIPACILFNSILGMVIYFYINGLRFYVDYDKIYSPKKIEDWESLQNLKFIV